MTYAFIEETLAVYLTQELTDLIDGRLLPSGTEPDHLTLPAVTYQRIDGPRDRAQTGPTGLAHPRIQFNCYGKRYSDAKELAQLLRVSLDGFHGDMLGTRVDSIEVVNDQDWPEPTNQRFRVIVDAIVWSEEVTV